MLLLDGKEYVTHMVKASSDWVLCPSRQNTAALTIQKDVLSFFCFVLNS